MPVRHCRCHCKRFQVFCIIKMMLKASVARLQVYLFIRIVSFVRNYQPLRTASIFLMYILRENLTYLLVFVVRFIKKKFYTWFLTPGYVMIVNLHCDNLIRQPPNLAKCRIPYKAPHMLKTTFLPYENSTKG